MSPDVVRKIRLFATGGLATLTITSSFLLAAGMAWPSFLLAPTLSSIHEARSDAALTQAPADLGRAEIETRATLTQSPMNASAWARRAYIMSLRSPRLTPEALRDLEISYEVAPLGPELSIWRLRFTFENWPHLSPPLRESARRELRNFARYHKGSGTLAAGIQNPSGHLAANLTVNQAYADSLR